MTNPADRFSKLDNIKVILMILVIIAHTLIHSYGDKSAAIIRFACLTYTMPMFCFISGYLTKTGKAGTLFWKSTKHLLIPCIIFSVINNFIYSTVDPNFHIRYDIPGFTMWYLWALFIYKITWPLMRQIPYIWLIALLGFFIAPIFPDIFSTRLSLNRLVSFYPFFVLGALYKEKNLSDTLKNVNINKYLLMGGGICYLCSMILLYHYPAVTYQTAFNQSFQGPIYIGLLIRIFLLFYILFTGIMFWAIVPCEKVFYSHYGSRTLTVYIWHGCIILPFAYLVFQPFSEEDLFGKIAMIVVPSFISVFLFSKQLNKVTQKYF